MNTIEHSSLYASHAHLRQLLVLRNIAIFTQVIFLCIAVLYFEMAIPVLPMIFTIALLGLFNIYTGVRLSRTSTVSSKELFLQLCIDIMVLTSLLGLSGGANNPFSVLYILPLTIAAMILPSRKTWILAALTVIAYSLLFKVYYPIPHNHGDMSEFNLHVIGMWIGFVLSAGIVAYFIVSLRKIIQQQERRLNEAKQEAARNDQLIKLGMIATSSAHEFGTPLNSIELLLEDIEEISQSSIDIIEITDLIRQQIERCRDALKNLAQTSGTVHLQGGQARDLSSYLNTQHKNWQKHFPDTLIEMVIKNRNAPPSVINDALLDHALNNIIENAVQASSDKISVILDWDDEIWKVQIRDYGDGIPEKLKNNIGRSNFTTKTHGLGLGLFITHSIIQRLGGVVEFYNHHSGGLCTDIKIPINLATL